MTRMKARSRLLITLLTKTRREIYFRASRIKMMEKRPKT